MMEDLIDISGIDKAELLSALYNASHQQGMGFLHARGDVGMTVDEAREEIAVREKHNGGRLYFDYLHGRVMKVNITEDTMAAWGYDRDNGRGAVQDIVNRLREGRL